MGDEEFEVIAGQLGVRSDGEEHVLTVGERLTVTRGAVHEWWNAGDETVRLRGRLWNPGRFEEALTTIFALINQGQVTARGTPKVLDGAVWVAEYGDEYEASFMPWAVRWVLAAMIAPVALVLGHHVPIEYVEPPQTA